MRSRDSREERAIARDLRQGRRSGLDSAYAAYGGSVLGYLQGALGDRGAAEDVCQQVFLEVWRRGKQYDAERGSLFTWVMTIARSRAIDYLRKRVPEPRDTSDPASPQAQLESPAAQRELDELLDRWRVAALLDRIPREEADLMRMRFYEDLSQTEISERTGIALGTVKMRMVKALTRLRELIEAEEIKVS
jgi:RNA polymerase sigma-70 factor (ECF subfamily)